MEPGGAVGADDRRQRRRAAPFLRGLIGGFLTGAEGGGPSLLMSGLRRDRYDSPSTTRSKALFLKRSTALWASRASSKAISPKSICASCPAGGSLSRTVGVRLCQPS